MRTPIMRVAVFEVPPGMFRKSVLLLVSKTDTFNVVVTDKVTIAVPIITGDRHPAIPPIGSSVNV